MKIRKTAIALVACAAAGIGVLGFSAPAAHADTTWGYAIHYPAK